MTDSYSSDSDEDCGLFDGLTLPAPWNPAAMAHRCTDRHSEESRGLSRLTLPSPWAPAAAASAPRRSASPPWRSNEGSQQEDDAALLAAAAAATAAAETAEVRDQMRARAVSTGTLTALVSSARSPSTGGVSPPGLGAQQKPGGWLSTLAAQHSPELLRGSGKFGSAPDFGDVQMRIRAHRPSVAGARPRSAPLTFTMLSRRLRSFPGCVIKSARVGANEVLSSSLAA